MKIKSFLSLLLVLVGCIGAQAQLTPYFTGQVITTKALDATHLQVRFKSPHGYTFADITSGDILAVKYGKDIVRYTIDATSTAGFHPNLDGTLTLTPLDGYTGAIPVGKPTLPTVIYREVGGVAPLEYQSQNWLNWNLLNHTLIGMNTDVASASIGSFGVTLDGGGGIISTGSKGFVTIPYACTITKWFLSANVSGSIVMDIKRDGVSIIGAGNKPTLSSTISGNAVVSGWTSVAVAEGDIIEWYVDSAATLTNVSLTIKITK